MDKVVIKNLDDLKKFIASLVRKANEYDKLNEIFHKYDSCYFSDLTAEHLKQMYEFIIYKSV